MTQIGYRYYRLDVISTSYSGYYITSLAHNYIKRQQQQQQKSRRVDLLLAYQHSLTKVSLID